MEGFPDLVAWWKFDEPNADPGIFARHTVARDASGRGNDLQLETPPAPRPVEIQLVRGRVGWGLGGGLGGGAGDGVEVGVGLGVGVGVGVEVGA